MSLAFVHLMEWLELSLYLGTHLGTPLGPGTGGGQGGQGQGAHTARLSISPKTYIVCARGILSHHFAPQAEREREGERQREMERE